RRRLPRTGLVHPSSLQPVDPRPVPRRLSGVPLGGGAGYPEVSHRTRLVPWRRGVSAPRSTAEGSLGGQFAALCHTPAEVWPPDPVALPCARGTFRAFYED